MATGNTTSDPSQESQASPSDDATIRETASQRSQRDLARITTEKIDAIESEIARDILKSPRISSPAENMPDEQASEDETSPEYAPTNLFHTTLIRVDKETMILFKEDMDD